MAAAFRNKTIAGAVTLALYTVAPSRPKMKMVKMWMRLVDLGVPYSMNIIMVSKDYLRRSPGAATTVWTKAADRECAIDKTTNGADMIRSLISLGIVSWTLLSSAWAPCAEAQTKITFAYSSVGAMATGVWMAKESGAFEKNGIQADLIFISSGPVVVQALIGGDLHGGSAATNAVVNAILSGAPIIGVAGTANRPYHRLFVQPEINRVEDLKGKTLGVTRFGSITDNLTRIILRRAGLEGAVNVRQMGGTLEVAAAFQNRQIAGAVTGDLRVAPTSQPKILIKLIDFGIPYSMNTLAVSRDYLRRAPDTVERIVRAYAEGVAFMNQQKERTLKAIMKYAHMSDAKEAEEHYRDSVTYLDRVARADPEAVQTILEFIGKKGMPAETFMDNTIIDKLTREGFFDRLYKKS